MQRGARFFQKQCFPCSVALVLGRGGAGRRDLQGQDEFHQQGQRAKHKHQNPKEETLYKKLCNSRSTAPAAIML